MTPDFPKYRQNKTSVSHWQQLVESYSHYLAFLSQQNPDITPDRPDELFEKLLTDATKQLGTKNADVMKILRQTKSKCALLFASADLSGVWGDLDVMHHLSRLADFCVTAALRHLLLKHHADKNIKLKNIKKPEEGCGIAVIALGKWGAYELNYSSDIDLMVIFDPAKAPVADADEVQNFFVRLTRDLARMIDHATEDGYVFRTDLRLRPDPGAMPLAVSIGTAEIYYGSMGQNWERAAMIKARVASGDASVGADFMRIMHAWIWRKNLDFAAIQDIHSIKRQINSKHAQPKTGKNPWAGFNVKLGHGGIREIEFFAQTQQLIFGGREPQLRTPQTLTALKALADTGHITKKQADTLHDAYLFLRHTEHRLQMQEDRQTHSLPLQEPAFKKFAAFAEFDNEAALIKALEKHTGAVKKLYQSLFTEAPNLSITGNLVFTGVEDDPETLLTLNDMGFKAPEKITAAIRGWHHGRYRAMRSERARQILTELIPLLLQTLGKTPHPDDAFLRFDAFLMKLPSGVPIFSMFAQNPRVMELVATVMGSAPALAEALGTHPQVLDGVLSKDFFGRLPTLDVLKKELARHLSFSKDYQDILDDTRKWAREKRFHAGIHILQNLSPDAATSLYFSDIAETVVSTLLPYVQEDFARQHGTFKTGELIIVAMGSFAGRHMFADSDLDIIALYKTAPKEKASNGAKPLPPNAYYIRLVQRIISAISAPTAEGALYTVDMRLRPAGDDGPLAAQFDGYFDYQRKDAWVWEHMSLIRSRIVYGEPETIAAFEDEKLKILTAPRDDKKLKTDMRTMRQKIDKKFGSKDPWMLKYASGGIMDIMFATHYLMLKHAPDTKGILHQDLGAGLEAMYKKKLLSQKDFKSLHTAISAILSAQGFLRLTAEIPFKPDAAAPALLSGLAQRVSGKTATFKTLAKEMKTTMKAAADVYKDIFAK